MKELELQYDDHTVLIVTVAENDASFDHEFGTERASAMEVESVSIVTYIGDMDYDVTKSMSEKEIEYFREWSEEEIIRKELL